MAKQIKVREDNYFAVQGWMVTELKLKGNALMLYAIIYGFSQTTNTAFTGSVDYLCEWLGGVSRPTVINTLDNLVKQGLLTKSSTTKGALIYNSYTALRPSKKILSDEDPTSKKTLPDTSKNFLLNKDSKDNIEKSISKEMEGKAPKKKSYSTILEDPVNKFVKEALSKFIQYCRGKNYTPIPKLDEITNGWLWGEDLVVLTGRTNVGKTWIGEYFATMAWNMGYKILMYSGEMSTAMVGFRFDTLNKHFSNMGLLNGSGTLGKKPDTDGAKYLQEDYEKYIQKWDYRILLTSMTMEDFLKQAGFS